MVRHYQPKGKSYPAATLNKVLSEIEKGMTLNLASTTFGLLIKHCYHGIQEICTHALLEKDL